MTSSLIGTDRATHAKIVGTALIAVLAFLAVGFWAHWADETGSGGRAVVKASSPTLYTSSDGVTVR